MNRMPEVEPRMDRMVVVVVGAHLRAELNDRATAETLRALAAAHPVTQREDMQIALCTDIWYVNNDALRARPTISVGHPDVNALAAFLADRLPAAFTIDDVMTVQMDLEFVDPVASCWGMTHGDTAAAAEMFATRYLGDFLERAARSLPET
ncbi:MAG: hypothetical protein KDA21_12755 [Phycisphaerales bacterium]|nr:hypothetical protein [Phycisphaerales bacterium]